MVMRRYGITVLRLNALMMNVHHNYTKTFKAKAKQLPQITVKVSASLDGKQANDNGQSQWITNKEVKQDVYKLRHRHDAVLTGRRTVELDDPQYTTRIQDGKNPIK